MLRISLLITLGLTACLEKPTTYDDVSDEEDTSLDDTAENEDDDTDSEDDDTDSEDDDTDSEDDDTDSEEDTSSDDTDASEDSDGDGVPDEEDAFPNDASETTDSDGDGLGNNAETSLGTDQNNSDSDGDGLGDGDEVNTYGTDPLSADTDGDGLSDGDEVNVYGSDPTTAPTLSGTNEDSLLFVDSANNCSSIVSYTTIATDPSLPTCAECEYVWTLDQTWLLDDCGFGSTLAPVSIGLDVVNSTGTGEIYFYFSDDGLWGSLCYDANGQAYSNASCSFTGNIAGGIFTYEGTFDYSGYTYNGYELDSLLQTLDLTF